MYPPMTDERLKQLRTWLIRLGRLDSVEILELFDDIYRLKAVVDRLPHYADTGEAIMPGSVVWILVGGKPRKDTIRYIQIDSIVAWWTGDVGYSQPAYSSKGAAQENSDGK